MMGEKIVNGFLFLLSITYFYFAKQYAFGSLTAPKTGFLPQLVGGCAIAVSGYLFLISLLGKGDAKHVKLNCDYKRLFLLIGTMGIYILVFELLGYLISTTILLYAVMKIGLIKGWKIPLVVSVLSSVCFYTIFKVFLSVPLPSGRLF